MYNAIPPQFDAGLVEVVDDCLGGFYRFQPVFFTGDTRIAFRHNTVELVEYLHVGIYRKLAPFQPQQDTPLTGAYLAGALIAGSTVYQRHVTPLLVVPELFQQAGFAFWKCMVERFAELFT